MWVSCGLCDGMFVCYIIICAYPFHLMFHRLPIELQQSGMIIIPTKILQDS